MSLTFTDNADWRNAISSISVDGLVLAADKYNTTAPGTLVIDRSVFTTAKSYLITISAGGYSDAVVTRTMQAAGGGSKPIYTVIPLEDAVYTIGTTPTGIKTMTVNAGENGLRYFAVGISPVIVHSGNETVVFTHERDGFQRQINATRADFDLVGEATAGFNVLDGDVIKVYLVDKLSNALDFNPTILQ